MDHFTFAHILEELPQVRVLCMGDVMLDHFSYGQVVRISPEAPVPIFRAGKKTTVLGGAGNVVRNLASLGAHCHFIGVIGPDTQGQEIETLFKKIHKTQVTCVVEAGRRTTIKTRFVSGGQQILRVDDEDTFHISPSTQDALLAAFVKALPSIDMVILSDYSKGVFTPSLLTRLIETACAHSKPVVVDPKALDYRCYKGATFITPNAHELAQATSLPVSCDEEVVEATSWILRECGVEGVLATRGAKGMTLHEYGDVPHHFPTQALEVFDVSGAGDTVIACFAAALGAGASAAQAAHLANVAAGLVVAKAGTATLSLEELAGALDPAFGHGAQGKHAPSKEDALTRVVQWHREGFKIGFTNGCFDILHPGHVSLLQEARKACDRLIVALNSDASVKRLKGPARPFQDEKARMRVLEALSDVDLVVLFEEDTPLELITYLRPDVLVKGADYALDQVVGAKEVLSWGGDVVLAVLQEGHSTTGIAQRMA